jgi:hypothetical protein
MSKPGELQFHSFHVESNNDIILHVAQKHHDGN